MSVRSRKDILPFNGFYFHLNSQLGCALCPNDAKLFKDASQRDKVFRKSLLGPFRYFKTDGLVSIQRMKLFSVFVLTIRLKTLLPWYANVDSQKGTIKRKQHHNCRLQQLLKKYMKQNLFEG